MIYKDGNNLYELTILECLSIDTFVLIDTERLDLNELV